MRAAFPYILVLLALFAAFCIAYIAWELTADRKRNGSRIDPGNRDEAD